MATATGTFEVRLTPGAAELEGAVARAAIAKRFEGELQGEGIGVMLSAGDPATGAAGYVAIETVDGTLEGRSGRFALVQLATMHAASRTLRYVVVPGSGSGELEGITGELELTIDPDGTHRFVLVYEL